MMTQRPSSKSRKSREISAITYGFMASGPSLLRSILTSSRISRAAINSLSALVQATNIAENRLETLLTALKS